MASPVRNEMDVMKRLYSREVEATKGLYQAVGYFMWMRFWPTIKHENVSNFIKSATTPEQCLEIYIYMMNLMNRYIQNSQGVATTENVNNMIFNRNMVERLYSSDPPTYVRELKECIRKEEEILREHHISTIPTDQINGASAMQNSHEQDTKDILLSQNIADENIESLQNMDLSSPICLDTIDDYTDVKSEQVPRIDNEFLNTLEDSFNRYETSLRKKSDLEADLSNKKTQLPLDGQSNYDPPISLIMQMSDLQERLSRNHQEIESLKTELLEQLEDSMERLGSIQAAFLQSQRLMEVKLKSQDYDCSKYDIISIFNRFAKVLVKVHRSGSVNIEDIVCAYMRIALIPTKHPKEFVFIDNEERDSKPKVDEEGKAAGKKAGKTAKGKNLFCTKANEFFSAEFMVLGQDELSDFIVNNMELKLMAKNQKCGEVVVPGAQTAFAFPNIQIQGYRRSETGNVYEQFVQLSLTVKVSCFFLDLEMTTKTLPFYLCTGAVQKLELIGARMWYCGNCYNDTTQDIECRDELPVEAVLGMLENRIRYKNPLCGGIPARRRSLSYGDKECLKAMIPNKNSGSRKTVSLHSFIKAKVFRSADKKDPEKSFSFFSWFYASVNTLEADSLLEPWMRGIVYGYMTHDNAKQLLMADTVLPNTAVVRPGKQYVLKPHTTEAHVNLALTVKIRRGDEDGVFDAYLKLDQINSNGLKAALRSIIDLDDEPLVCQVLTPNGTIDIDDLEDVNKSESAPLGYHATLFERVEKLRIRSEGTSKGYVPPRKSSRCEQSCDVNPRRRKTRRDTGTSFSSDNSMPTPEYQYDYQNDMASPGAASHCSASGFSPGPQCYNNNNNNETSDTEANGSQSRSGAALQGSPTSGHWTNLGNVQVNLSGLSPVRSNPSNISVAQPMQAPFSSSGTAMDTTQSNTERRPQQANPGLQARLDTGASARVSPQSASLQSNKMLSQDNSVPWSGLPSQLSAAYSGQSPLLSSSGSFAGLRSHPCTGTSVGMSSSHNPMISAASNMHSPANLQLGHSFNEIAFNQSEIPTVVHNAASPSQNSPFSELSNDDRFELVDALLKEAV